MVDYPKGVRRAFRELAELAYEREMERELGRLAQSFDAWRAGQIDVWDLDRRVHKYHQGPARELYNKYADSRQADMLVAGAVMRGEIGQESVPQEVKPYLDDLVSFFRTMERGVEGGQTDASAPESGSGEM